MKHFGEDESENQPVAATASQLGRLVKQFLAEQLRRVNFAEFVTNDFVSHSQQTIVLSALLAHDVEASIDVLLRPIDIESNSVLPEKEIESRQPSTSVDDVDLLGKVVQPEQVQIERRLAFRIAFGQR